MEEDIYNLEQLLMVLDEIKNNGHGNLNFPKAFYCLAIEIQKLKKQVYMKEWEDKVK